MCEDCRFWERTEGVEGICKKRNIKTDFNQFCEEGMKWDEEEGECAECGDKHFKKELHFCVECERDLCKDCYGDGSDLFCEDCK